MPATDKTIQINIRSVYGNAQAYPVCKAAKTFAEIAGTKTLTLASLKQIDELGYAIFNTCGGSVVSCINPREMRDLSNVI